MAKNMIRKSLAIGSGLALAVSGIVSTPAFAAAGIDITAKNAKSVYGMLEGEEFTFEVAGNADFNTSQQDKLRVEVVNVTGGSAASGIKIGTTVLASANDITLIDGTNSTDVAMDADAGDAAVFGLGDGTTSSMTTPFTFSFTSTATASKSQAYTVTAFVDANNDGVRQSTELASPSRTVTWYDSTNVELVYDIDPLVENDTTASVSVTSSQIALDQLVVAETGVLFTHADGSAAVSTTVVDVVAQNASNAAQLDAELTIDALPKGDGIKTQLVRKDTNVSTTNSSNIVVGNAASSLSSARVTGSIAASLVDDENGVTGSATGQARNEGTFSVQALVKDGESPAAALSGQAVTAKVTYSGTLSSSVTIAIGGTTYTDKTKLPGQTGIAKLAVGTTNADGIASFDITTDGTSDGDTITVDFYVENRTDAALVTLKDEVYTGFVNNINGDTVTTTDGTAVSVGVTVLDQFGGNAPNGYEVNAVFDTSSGYVAQATAASTSASGASATLSNGNATLTILDNGTGKGTNMYDIGFNNATSGATDTSIKANLKVKIVDAPNTSVGSFTLTDGSTALAADSTTGIFNMTASQDGASNQKLVLQNLNSTTPVVFEDHDSRSDLGDAAPNVVTAGQGGAVLGGTVTSSFSTSVASAALPNAPITVTGDGMLFKVSQNSSDVWGYESLSFNANASGVYSIDVYSQTAGKGYVTITSGSVSKEVLLYTADAAANTGTTWDAENIVTPAGKSFYVSATLLDRLGNPVDSKQSPDTNDTAVSVTWDGPVFTSPATLPTETDSKGNIKFGVAPGSNDSGTYSAIITYGGVDKVIGTGSDDVTVTITVTIGEATFTGEYGDVTAWTVNQNDGTAKVYVKFPPVGEKLRILHQTGGSGSYTSVYSLTTTSEDMDGLRQVAGVGTYVVRTIDLADGTNRIRVSLDGEDIEVNGKDRPARYNE